MAVLHTYTELTPGKPLVFGKFTVQPENIRYFTDGKFMSVKVPEGTVASTSEPNRYVTKARPEVGSPKSDWFWQGLTAGSIYVGYGWKNVGGDWINTAGTAQATTLPFFSFNVNAVTSGAYTYEVDLLSALTLARAVSRYAAFIVRCTQSVYRPLATNYSGTPPYIDVVYNDGETARLECHNTAFFDASSAYTRSGAPAMYLGYGDKGFIEFERPTKPLVSAKGYFTVTSHNAVSASYQAFLATPPRNTRPTLYGIAKDYPLDEGIESHPSVIMVHRPVNGSLVSDHFRSNSPDYEKKSSWSQDMYDASLPPEPTKLPYVGGMKFAGGGNVTIVPSTSTDPNFKKLADGLAAFRINIPPQSTLPDGAAAGSSGAHGVTGMAFLPPDKCGNVGESYLRFYLYIEPAPIDRVQDMRMLRTDTPSKAEYVGHGGKFGFGVSHWTPFGGNSGTAGGNLGWTNRGKWEEVAGDICPVNAITAGVHSWDMLGYDMMWGQEGGMGLMLYPGTWYCIETRLKLNTVDLVNPPLDADPGLNLQDAEMETWIDGRRVMLRVGFEYRRLPLAGPVASVSTQAFRRLGVREVTFNDFQGGLLPALTARAKYYSNMVLSTEYIGPMAFPADQPAWLPDYGEIVNIPQTNTWDSIKPPDSEAGGYSYFSDGAKASGTLGWSKVINDFSGGVYNQWWNPSGGKSGCFLYHGGGHSATADYSVGCFDCDTLTFSTLYRAATSGLYPLTTASVSQGENGNGHPLAVHTYDTLAVIGGPGTEWPNGLLVRCDALGGAGAVSDTYPSTTQPAILSTHTVHALDCGNLSAGWVRKVNNPSSTYNWQPGSCSAADPLNKKIWVVGEGNEIGYTAFIDTSGPVWTWNKVANTAAASPPWGYTDSKVMRYIPEHQILVLSSTDNNASDASRVRRFYWFDTLNPLLGWRRCTLSQPMPTRVAFAWAHVPRLNQLHCICGSDTSNIWKLEIPLDKTGTWNVTSSPQAGQTMAAQYVVGKRMDYVPNRDVVMYFGQAQKGATPETPVKGYRPS